MKKIVIALMMVAILMSCVVAFADTTGKTLWHRHSYTDKDSYVDKYSEYQQREKIELGTGIDVTLYEFDGLLQDYGFDSVNAEYKYDIHNNNQQVYVVTHFNAWRVIKKFLR